MPRSHLETDLSLIPSFSASCLCVKPWSFLFPAMYFPILIKSILITSFLLGNCILLDNNCTPPESRIEHNTAYLACSPSNFKSKSSTLDMSILKKVYEYSVTFHKKEGGS